MALIKRAFTLIELVVVVVIVAFLSVATFKAVSKIVIKSFKAKETTRLTLQSQIVLDQLSNLLADRIPATVIGYDPASGDYRPISQIETEKYKILEWFIRAMDDYKNGHYSGFCDIVPTVQNDRKVVSGGFAPDQMYHTSYNLIFAGSFDRALADVAEFNASFGWHGGESNNSFDISLSDSNSSTIYISDSVLPKFAYEKYFLTYSAFAVARGADIDKNAPCLDGLDVDDNTLLLFYNYHPWQHKTFCADPQNITGVAKEGNVTVLMHYVQGFFAKEQDYTIRLKLDINRTIRGLSDVHFTKQKVIF